MSNPFSSFEIVPISAFKDNYIWCLEKCDENICLMIDPGDAGPVIHYLEHHQKKLEAILLTHHHQDHVGGVKELCAKYSAACYGPQSSSLVDRPEHEVTGGQSIFLAGLDLSIEVIAVPGHTLDHLSYYIKTITPGLLFVGDTLFSAGCGRVFEGTMAEMYQSLQKLAQFPNETLVYCAHEYTEANLKFAQTVEPDNARIREHKNTVAQLRALNKPSLPSTLGLEKEINPFLRCHHASVIASATQYAASQGLPFIASDPAAVFAILRHWKNHF